MKFTLLITLSLCLGLAFSAPITLLREPNDNRERAISIDLGGAGPTLRRDVAGEERAVSVDLGGVGASLRRDVAGEERAVSVDLGGAGPTLRRDVAGVERAVSVDLGGAGPTLRRDVAGVERAVSVDLGGAGPTLRRDVAGEERAVSVDLGGAEATIRRSVSGIQSKLCEALQNGVQPSQVQDALNVILEKAGLSTLTNGLGVDVGSTSSGQDLLSDLGISVGVDTYQLKKSLSFLPISSNGSLVDLPISDLLGC
ncbi:hypothetical protein CBS101457_002404 [Exobasidium rhododendri]|nr:hypothetical protein CBS101457_002404 [Exobasidium rhododendri]